MIIGVLAIQGAFREHIAALRDVGADACEVRTAAELSGVDALIVPGGESTTMRMGLERAGLTEPLRARLIAGMPALGTCAGLVVLGKCAPDIAPPPFGVLDVTVARNGFGRQPFSFEAIVSARLAQHGRASELGVVASTGAREMPGVFIRAPRIERVGEGVEVIGRIATGTHSDEPVIVRQGLLVGCTFHPELTDDRSLHHYFATLAASAPATIRSASSAKERPDTTGAAREETSHGWP